MKICRFKLQQGDVRVGVVTDTSVIDLSSAGAVSLEAILESPVPSAAARAMVERGAPELPIGDVRLCAPIDRHEVWAAGVTYLRSKTARMEESDFSATAYDRVYDADRPELFFKSLPEKVVGPGGAVGIRQDARWSVPEPELALVMNSRGRIVGYSVGNDMSSRDIEGENLLYLPQAKVYAQSCAIGPWIELDASEAAAREWTIGVRIERRGAVMFAGETSVAQIKRSFENLAGYLFRSQRFPYGAVLLTGTGVVPPDSFTLEAGDVVRIEIGGIGVLENPVVVV